MGQYLTHATSGLYLFFSTEVTAAMVDPTFKAALNSPLEKSENKTIGQTPTCGVTRLQESTS